MGFVNDEEREIEKKVERQKELSETTLNVNAQVEMVQCPDIGNQFIEECDIKALEEGIGKESKGDDEGEQSGTIESPHTGKDVNVKKVQTVNTTNKEDLSLGIIGDPSAPITAYLQGIGWKNSRKGGKEFNRRMFMLQSAVIAFLIGIIMMDVQPERAIIESRLFLVATTAVSTGGTVMFIVEWWHRKYDNFYDMRFLCLDHAMDGSLHIGVSLDDPDYHKHLVDWYGETSDAVVGALESMEQNFVETIQEKTELIYELDAQRDVDKQKNYKKLADRLSDHKLDYKEITGSNSKWKLPVAVSISCVASVLGTLGVLYML